MDKMEQIQQDRDNALELAKDFHCENYLTDTVPDQQEQTVKLRSFFFERLKHDVASKLSVLEAYYVASNSLNDQPDCLFIFEGLQEIDHGISMLLDEYKDSVLCEEEEEELDVQ